MLKMYRIWKSDIRSGRFICLIAMIILGCFSITSTSLLVRSEKKTEIEESLIITGDYDVIIYSTDIGFEENLYTLEDVDEIGLYYELGSVTNIDETSEFKAVTLKDGLSEDIYHMTCFRGAYPQNDSEIAIDVSVANTYGIAPYPGETLLLKMYDSKGEYIGTQNYTVSGVFRDSAMEVAGGWYRCPEFAFDNDSYHMPAIFFYNSNLNAWKCTKETVFFKTYAAGSSIINKVAELLEKSGYSSMGVEYNSRRSGGYSWYVGLDNRVFGMQSLEKIQEAVNDGLFKRDFYSAFIVPIITLLIITIEAVSLYMLSKNIISDRKEYYAILRSIGMSSKKIVISLLLEILGWGVVGALIGIGLGFVSHNLLIWQLNNVLHLRLFDGIHVDSIIKQITYDPVVMSLLVCISSLGLSLTVPLYRLYKMYPAELLSTSERLFVEKRKRNNQTTIKANKSWIGLLNSRINLHDWSTMLVMIIVLSSLLLGTVFFKAFSEQATGEERGYMEMLGIEGTGYVVCRSSELIDWGYNVSNRHDAGIVPSFPEQIENCPDIEKSWAVIMNESTRMVFDREPDANIQELLGNRLLNYQQSDDPFVVDSLIAEDIIFEHTGYNPDVYMYELPTVGLTFNEMDHLESEIVAGQINIDNIMSGEEVVLAVTPDLQEICLKCFPIGSSLSFDDIILSEEEEKLNFKTLNDDKWIVYDNFVETPAGETYLSYGAFGTRYNINSKVGAIVVLHDERDVAEYLTTGSLWVNHINYFAGINSEETEPRYGMSVLCLAESFESWGLPDRNYTSVKAELKKDCDIYQFDEFWYKALSGSVDVQTKSTYDYLDQISIGTNRIMTTFFILILVLIILGVMSIVTGLYTKTRGNLSRFQILRRLGLSVKQACIMIYTQNALYPIIATVISIVPVLIMQKIFSSVNLKLQNGELDILGTPWYTRIPWWADLFSYDFIPTIIGCLLLGFLLIVIGTLPQIMYLHRMKMIETREE